MCCSRATRTKSAATGSVRSGRSTGLDCPLCGGLRGTYALLHGDVATALDHNVLLPLFLVVAMVLGVAAWLRPGRAPSAAVWWSVGAVAAVFFVLRNLPWFPYLASGA